MGRDKRAALREIKDKALHLEKSPLYEYRQKNGYQPVIGEGNPEADVVFIGEAPGAQEAKSGRPFVGQAGEILDELLRSIGLERQRVYITNVVKDRPPQNRDPTAEEIRLYAPFLERQIEIIQPSILATLGRFAMDFVLKEFDMPQQGRRIGELHGQILEAQASYGDIYILPLYHPAAVFYNRELMEKMRIDFGKLKQML